MSFWSFLGKLALFDMLFSAHSSDSSRKTEYPSYTRRYGYDYDDCDCGCRSTGYSSLDPWHDDPDPYDADDDW